MKRKKFDTKKLQIPYKERVEIMKRDALTNLRLFFGNVSLTCEKLGISRQTFYNWRAQDSEFNREVEEIDERTLDMVESKLIEGINEGNARLIMFYLNCKGKKRGYGLKNENETDKSSGIIINISQEEADF